MIPLTHMIPRRNLVTRIPVHRFRRAGIAAAFGLIVLSATSCTDVTGTSSRDLQILWPQNGSILRDEELFQARVRGRDLLDYEIYWSVDDGSEEPMWDEWDDGSPYKAYLEDTWYWNWNGAGPYDVTFIAEDYRGREIARRTVRVYVE